MQTLEQLERSLKALTEAKQRLELADDFCYTNGNMDALMEKILRVRYEITKIRQAFSASPSTTIQ